MIPSSQNTLPIRTPQTGSQTPTPTPTATQGAAGSDSPSTHAAQSSTRHVGTDTEHGEKLQDQQPPIDVPRGIKRVPTQPLVHIHIKAPPRAFDPKTTLPLNEQLAADIAATCARPAEVQTASNLMPQATLKHSFIDLSEGRAAPDIAPYVDSLLLEWPQATPLTPEAQHPEQAQQAVAQQAVAAMAIQPFHWEGLPPDVQNLVIDVLFGHADQLQHGQAEEAAQLRQGFGRLLFLNKAMCTTVLRSRDRVLLCALRLAPMSHPQVLGTPLHRLLGHEAHPQETPYPLLHMLQALASAIARLPTDELAVHAALVLGQRLLQQLKSPQATFQDRRTLQLAPILLVQALRHRMHPPGVPGPVIGEALRQLATWAGTLEPALALPLLAELQYTLLQVDGHEQDQPTRTFGTDRIADPLLKSMPRASWAMGHPDLGSSIDALVDHLPNPIRGDQVVYTDPQQFTDDLTFLANYPCDFVGFASEAFASLKEQHKDLQPDEEQTQLLRRCEARANNPLQGPAQQGDH